MMKQLGMVCPRRILVILGFSCACASVSMAQAASLGASELTPITSQFNGVYTGSNQTITTSDKSCRPTQQVTINVHNGQFKMAWHEPLMFNAKVASNGTFFATAGGTLIQAEKHMTLLPTLQGRISETGLIADYGTRWCRYRLEATLS